MTREMWFCWVSAASPPIMFLQAMTSVSRSMVCGEVRDRAWPHGGPSVGHGQHTACPASCLPDNNEGKQR